MENTESPTRDRLTLARGTTQLTAVNAAKVLTILCLIGCVLVFGISDLRQVTYLCLHVSYCLWWLLEQWFYPQRRRMSSERVGFVGVSFTLLFVGFFTRCLVTWPSPIPYHYR